MIVFLKDVSHTALKDLIQFMYCGEVNVKQEALPAFISTAEALQIKGLTDVSITSQQFFFSFLLLQLFICTYVYAYHYRFLFCLNGRYSSNYCP